MSEAKKKVLTSVKVDSDLFHGTIVSNFAVLFPQWFVIPLG